MCTFIFGGAGQFFVDMFHGSEPPQVRRIEVRPLEGTDLRALERGVLYRFT